MRFGVRFWRDFIFIDPSFNKMAKGIWALHGEGVDLELIESACCLKKRVAFWADDRVDDKGEE